MTPKQIVEENFKGLSDFIDDKDILEWYKDLIETCIEDYAEQELKKEKTFHRIAIDKRENDLEAIKMGYEREHKKNEALKEAMQEFVARVDKGEVRSTYTYNKFKELLK